MITRLATHTASPNLTRTRTRQLMTTRLATHIATRTLDSNLDLKTLNPNLRLKLSLSLTTTRLAAHTTASNVLREYHAMREGMRHEVT